MSARTTPAGSGSPPSRFRPGAEVAGDPDGEVRALLEAPERPVYLAGANLSGADLHGLDLAGVVLCGANLRGADLSGVTVGGDFSRWPALNLSAADLTGANLSGATLRGVSFRKATLCDITWTDAQVTMVGEGSPLEACDFLGSTHDFPRVPDKLAESGDREANRVTFSLSGPFVLDGEGRANKSEGEVERRDHFFPPWTLL